MCRKNANGFDDRLCGTSTRFGGVLWNVKRGTDTGKSGCFNNILFIRNDRYESEYRNTFLRFHTQIHTEISVDFLVVEDCADNMTANLYIGGSRGGRRDARPPPLGQIFFIFMQFLGKIGQIVCWRPPLWGWRPPVWEILDPPLLYVCKQSF